MKQKRRIFVGDFETSVYQGQTETEVWASAIVEMFTDNVIIFHSIDETFDYLVYLNEPVLIYYHNLKFDGNFWLWFLKFKKKFSEAYIKVDEHNITWRDNKDMLNNTFKYLISDMGMWYSIYVKVNDITIEIRDSLKLLPFSVKAIGKSFQTKHKKLNMDYFGYRYAGCEITDEEKEYIRNDVLVVKEALEIMYDKGHTRMTIGSCCMGQFKSMFKGEREFYDVMFPDLTKFKIDENIYGCDNAFNYIRRSYKGGWCYLVPEKAEKKYTHGCSADVNSLYPSMMHSESGNYYPVAKPTFWSGDYIPDEATINNRYFFIRIRTCFKIKEGMLPTIQIKGNLKYKATEWLTTSDVKVKEKDGYSYHRFLLDENNNPVLQTVTLTLTCTDYYLLLSHYNLYDTEILDGCWFATETGLFDDYINYYRDIKIKSKGAMRTLAKLFLNNLYGKFAMNDDSSFKIISTDEDILHYTNVEAHDKKVGYIPIGSAITSYARNFTINAAQYNYYGADKDGFIYADTDSIHCSLSPKQVQGITVHPTDFCCWKMETTWDAGIFIRQKTYVEHIIEEDMEKIDSPYWNIKCAGMPERCKELFLAKVNQKDVPDEEKERMSEDVKNFMYDEKGNLKKASIDDFKVGLVIPGKLVPKNIKGGVLLVETDYTIRP